MKNKLVFGAGVAVGYVLGTRAGRESYEQIKTKAQELWNDPKVQDTVSSTTEALKDKAPEVSESVKDALNKGGSDSGSDTVSKVKDAVSKGADKAKDAASDAKEAASKGADQAKDAASKGADKAKDAADKGSDSVKNASPVVPATGNSGSDQTGPSGGNPHEVEDTPFTAQDEDTRPNLGK